MVLEETKMEQLYRHFGEPKDIEPTELGRQQFHDKESRGIDPDNPDPYYKRLMYGKSNLTTTQNLIIEFSSQKFGWDGWYQHWAYWEGKRWMLRYLFDKRTIAGIGLVPPDWLFEEIEPFPELEKEMSGECYKNPVAKLETKSIENRQGAEAARRLWYWENSYRSGVYVIIHPEYGWLRRQWIKFKAMLGL